MLKQQTKGSLAALTANTIFGFSFLFSKIALDHAHPLIILAVRFTVAFAVMNLMWLCGMVKPELRGKPKKRLILMAIAQPLLYFIFELYGIDYTSSAMSGIIISLVPVGVILLSTLFLKERPTLPQILFSSLSLAAVIGISLSSSDGGTSHLIGIILLIAAVICAAVFNILSRSESARFSPFERTYVMFLIGTVGFNLLAPLVLRGNYLSELTAAITATPFWGAIAYQAILSSIAAFMLYNYATTNISTVRAASFANITTVVSVIAGMLILGDELSIPQIICCVLIIIGVWGVNR